MTPRSLLLRVCTGKLKPERTCITSFCRIRRLSRSSARAVVSRWYHVYLQIVSAGGKSQKSKNIARPLNFAAFKFRQATMERIRQVHQLKEWCWSVCGSESPGPAITVAPGRAVDYCRRDLRLSNTLFPETRSRAVEPEKPITHPSPLACY